MEACIRPDLDGLRLYSPTDDKVWLMIHGRRKLIVNSAVYESLFFETENLYACNEISSIEEGSPLNEDTCLAKGVGRHEIYLITGSPQLSIRKYHITNFETFADYCFDASKVQQVPSIVIDGIPEGKPISSASASIIKNDHSQI